MDIVLQFEIKASPETVFKAITTKKGFQGWWAKVCDIDCNLHGISSIRFEKPGITEEMTFETTEIVANSKLLWACKANNVFESWIGASLLFHTEPHKKNTMFTFIQTAPVKNWKKHPEFSDSLAGWEFFMDSLKNYSETGTGDAWG